MAFFRYIKEAFNARPWGMWVAPNWIGVGAAAMLGFENPAFWVLGAGVELGYLLLLSTNARFRRVVDGKDLYASKQNTQKQTLSLLARLDPSDQKRFRQLEDRCQNMLEQQIEAPGVDLHAQAEGLGKLLFVYLKLLLTRTGILRVLEGGGGSQSIDMKILEVDRQLRAAGSPELQRSLTDQLEILTERKKRRGEAREKL